MLIPGKPSRAIIAVAAAGALLVAAPVAEARVTHITISSTTSAFNGRVFGDVGAYEQVRGTAAGELDPLDPRNAVITDINLAPRNANGKVAYTATFTLRKPVDMSRASGTMLYEVNNRGNHIFEAAGFFNVGVSARNPDGSSVTGPTFARFVAVAGNVNTQSLPGRGRTPASLDTTKAKLISIAHENNVGVRTGVVEIPSG